MPALEQHKAKLLLAAAAGRLPDVASIDSFWLPLFLEGGHLQPLNAYWPADGSRRLPAVHDRDAVGSQRQHLRAVARDRLPRAVLPQGSRADAAADLGRADRHRQPHRTRARHLRLSLQRRPLGRRRCSITCRCSGRRAASWWTPTAGRSSASRRTASDWCACWRSCATRSAAARRRERCSRNNDYKQLSAAAIAGDVAMFLGGNWQIRELQGRAAAGRVREVGHRADPAGRRRARARPAPAAGSGWCSRAIPASGGRRRSSSSATSKRRHNAARISAATGHLPVRRSVYRDYAISARTPFAFFGEMLSDGHARPAVPIYRDLARAAARHRLRRRRRTRTPEQARRRSVDAPSPTEDARQRARTSSAATGFDPIALALVPRASWLGVAALGDAARGAIERCGCWLVAGDRARRGLSDLSDARARAPVVHRLRRAGRTVPLHARELRALRSRSRVLRHGRRDADLRGRRRSRCSWRSGFAIAWLIDAARRRRVARHARRRASRWSARG